MENKFEFELNDMYRAMFEENNHVLLVLDPKTGKMVHANKAACTYYQYSYDELTALNIGQINILSSDEISLELERARLEKRSHFNFTHRLSNNTFKRVEVISTPITLENKQYLYLVITDVSHKNKEQLMITGLFYESPNAMLIIDDEKNVLTINKSFTQLFGYVIDEIANKQLDKFIVPDHLVPDILINLDSVINGEVVNKNVIRRCKNDQLVEVNIIATPYLIGNEIVGALLVYTDITEQERTKREIDENKDQLQLILDSTAEGIYGIDIDGKCTFCNASGLKLLGYKHQSDLLGYNMHMKTHHSYTDGRAMMNEDCKIYQSMMVGIGTHVDDEVFFRADGTSFDVAYYSYPQYKNGKLVGSVITFTNNTVKKKNEDYIRYLTYHDSLTGLHNRKYFEDALLRLDSGDYLPITIVFGDINGLKLTNDVFGHKKGDKLLIESAKILKNVAREKDVVARLGGDEFVMILPQTNQDEAKQLIKRIKEEMSDLRVSTIKSSISLGYDTKTSKETPIMDVLNRAENTMYNAKTVGKNATNNDMVKSILDKLHLKSPREKQHSINVSELCARMGEHMQMNETEVRKLKDAGFMHDIGKIIQEDDILSKLDSLNIEEKRKMQEHPVVGYRILNLFENTLDLAEGVLNHHEHWNGTGYPKGLKGNEIPLPSRIIAVAEAYDSMTNAYNQDVMSHVVAIKEIKNESGKKYDPGIVKVFIGMMEKDN